MQYSNNKLPHMLFKKTQLSTEFESIYAGVKSDFNLLLQIEHNQNRIIKGYSDIENTVEDTDNNTKSILATHLNINLVELLKFEEYKIVSGCRGLKSYCDVKSKKLKYTQRGTLHQFHEKIDDFFAGIQTILSRYGMQKTDPVVFLHFLYYQKGKTIPEIFNLLVSEDLSPYSSPSVIYRIFEKILEWERDTSSREVLRRPKNEAADGRIYDTLSKFFSEVVVEDERLPSVDGIEVKKIVKSGFGNCSKIVQIVTINIPEFQATISEWSEKYNIRCITEYLNIIGKRYGLDVNIRQVERYVREAKNKEA